jgi:hypothetical protein
MSDEELFGMIPKQDGTFIIGNATEPRTSFRSAYDCALKIGGIFPKSVGTTIRYAPGWDESEEVERKRENALSLELSGIYKLAFSKVDQAIEDHLEKTNGFIGSFPPAKIALFSDYKSCKYDYFHHSPKEHSPPIEKRLRKAYEDVHQEWDKLPWMVFWAAMATLVFALVLFRDQIFVMFPQITAWVTASRVNYHIYTICVTAFLFIIDWIALMDSFEVDWEKNCLLYLIMLGVFYLWGGDYFQPTPIEEDSKEWVRTLIEVVTEWPVLIHCGITCLVQICFAIERLIAKRKYIKNLSRYRETFIQVWEEDYNKLNRYLRLRQLWCAYENHYRPDWLDALSRRVYAYRKEYESICKNCR